MRTIEDTPHDQRYLMVTHRLSNGAWERVCNAVRQWLASHPDTISETQSAQMLATIATPLPTAYHAFLIIHCYADVPAHSQWNTVFDPSSTEQQDTNATLHFGVFWRRAVLSTLEHGHHQIAVLEFPDGLPDLLASLPTDPDNEVSQYIGLCKSNDLLAIRRQIKNVT
jgi:hypothetical protein